MNMMKLIAPAGNSSSALDVRSLELEFTGGGFRKDIFFPEAVGGIKKKE